MTRKTCTKCGVRKPLHKFYRLGPQGLRPECSDCTKKARGRAAAAYGFALSILRDRHRDEFDTIYERAKQEVRAS